MYFTIGSALTIIAIVVGLAFSAWALLIGSTLIFRRKAQISYSLIRHAPGRSFFLGAVLLFLIGFVSLVLVALPVPAIKFFGWCGVMFLLSLATLGSGGLVLLVSDRLREYDSRLRPFVAIHRGALLIVASGLVPLLGLFVIFPAVLSTGIGAAVQAVFMRHELVSAEAEYIA